MHVLSFQLNRLLSIVPTSSFLSTLFIFGSVFSQTPIPTQDVYSLEQNTSFSKWLAGPICKRLTLTAELSNAIKVIASLSVTLKKRTKRLVKF